MLNKLVSFIRENNLSFYDLAVMTPEGIQSTKLQPCNSCNDSYSVAKAFTMTAIGMLWDEGRVHLDDPIAKYLGQHMPDDCDPKWPSVTIANALRHRMGLGKEFFDIDVFDANTFGTKDYLKFIFSQPLPHIPGEHRTYSDSCFYLLGRVVHAITGETCDRFLMRRLTSPLDFSEVAWSLCPHGHPMAGTGLYIKAEDMVKLAWLYMNKGVYNGTRYLSEEWVHTVIERGFELTPREDAPTLIGKGGMLGQLIIFSTKKPIAFAWHSHDPEGRNVALVKYIDSIL